MMCPPDTTLVCQFSRDWFLERFQLVIDDVLTEMEKALRAKLRWATQGRITDAERGSNVASQLRQLLERGLQVSGSPLVFCLFLCVYATTFSFISLRRLF